MGPAKVHSFMDKQSMFTVVNIAKLAQAHKARTGKSATIVVDGNQIMYKLYKNVSDNEWLMGGQLKELEQSTIDFVRAFKEIGVELVFFFDGASLMEHKERWLSRREAKTKSIVSIYADLKYREKNGHGIADMEKLAIQPPLVVVVARYIMKGAGGAKAVFVGHLDRNQDMIAYARKHECMGVITEDTNFLILGDGKYLSAWTLDVDNMTTRLYDGTALARTLGITFPQLPLFASLAGGDILTVRSLDSYHRRITRTPRGGFCPTPRLFAPIAQYVKRSPVGPALLEMLPTIARSEVQDASVLGSLTESVKYYTTRLVDNDNVEPEPEKQSIGWQKIVKIVREKHVQCEIPLTMVNILTVQRYESFTSLEDVSCKDLPTTEACYRELRGKIYGILLHEKPGLNATVLEDWSTKIKMIPVDARIEHPGLLALWSDDSSVELQRWQLFASTISLKLDVERVRRLPPRLVVPTCILYFLQHGPLPLLDCEVKAFLVTAVQLPSMDASQLRACRTENFPPARAVQLANLFGNGVVLLLLLLASCGFELNEFMPTNYLDGKLLLKNFLKKEELSNSLQHSPQQMQDEFDEMLAIIEE